MATKSLGALCVLSLLAIGVVAAATGPAGSANPTAVLTAPANVPYGADIALSGAGSFDPDGTLVRYIWRLDARPQVETAGPSYTFDISPASPLAPGPHTLSLVVVDRDGDQSSADERQVTVADGVAPTAVVDVDAVIPAGSAIEAVGLRSFDVGGAIVQYRWTLDSRPFVVTPEPSHIFAFDPANPFPLGVHTVALVVTDDSGNQSTPASAQFLITDTAAPTAIITVPDRVAYGQGIPVSGSRSFDIGGTVQEWRWTLDDQTLVATTDPGHTFPFDAAQPFALGTHTVQLVVVDDSGNESAPTLAQILVVDAAAPTAVITAPSTVPLGQGFAVSGSHSLDPDGRVVEYRWTIGSRPQAVTADPLFTVVVNDADPLPVGPLTLQLVVVDDHGNHSPPVMARVIVVDDSNPTAVVTAPRSVAYGQPIAVSGARSFDSGGAIARYEWSLDGGTPVATIDPSHTFPFDAASPFAIGRHTVQLIVEDSSGNRSEPDAAEVVVFDDNAPTAVIAAPARVSCGAAITVSGDRSFDVGGRIVQYEWRFDGAAPIVTAVPSYRYPPNPCEPSLLGQHTVQLIVTDDAGTESAPAQAVLLVVDDLAPTAVIDAPTQASCGAAIELSGERSFDDGGRIVRYEWRFDGGAPIVTDVPPHTFPPNPCEPSLLGEHTVQLVVTDDAGNRSAPTVARVTVIDATAPTVELTVPADGAVYFLNQALAAAYACADVGSGIASCAGTAANGSPVDTSVAGTTTFTVRAVDAAGNETPVTHTYHVRYGSSGFLPPVDNLPAVNAGTAGRTFPVKWRLADAGGAPLTSLATFSSLMSSPIACDGSPDLVLEEQLAAVDGVSLRYDASADQFIYNWQTSRGWRGCRLLQLTLADGTKMSAKFRLR